MIVYVESNFILELAFLRNEYEVCTALLNSAEAHGFRLALPAFSVGETYEAWVRRSKQRGELSGRLELSRSKPYEASTAESASVVSLLVRSSDEEKQRLDEALDRILNIAEVIPIDFSTIRAANVYQQNRTFSPQDSIVYASVLQHLTESSGEDACFVTKNSKDFDNPDIDNHLRGHNCRLFFRFSDALGYIQSRPSRNDGA